MVIEIKVHVGDDMWLTFDNLEDWARYEAGLEEGRRRRAEIKEEAKGKVAK